MRKKNTTETESCESWDQNNSKILPRRRKGCQKPLALYSVYPCPPPVDGENKEAPPNTQDELIRGLSSKDELDIEDSMVNYLQSSK